MNRLPARTGLDWLKQGFHLFRQQPGILTMLLFANFLVSMVLAGLPGVGTFIQVLLMPVFSIAVMQACNLIAQGQRVMPDVLLTGFRKPVLPRLLKLGAVYLGVLLLTLLCISLAVDEGFVKQFQAAAEAARTAPNAASAVKFPAFPLAGALVILAASILIMLMSFAAPLIYWKEMPPFKAIFYSVFGMLGAFKPILVMLVTGFAIWIILLQILQLVFGGNMVVFQAVVTWTMLMMYLVLQCAMFASYRQIYADPAPGPDA